MHDIIRSFASTLKRVKTMKIKGVNVVKYSDSWNEYISVFTVSNVISVWKFPSASTVLCKCKSGTLERLILAPCNLSRVR